MQTMKMLNGYLVIKPIFSNPTTDSGIINPYTSTPMGSVGTYKDQPWRALVLYAPKSWYNGGFEYDSEINEGDIVFLPGEVSSHGTGFIILDGVEYPAIRYSQVYSFYTPTEEERNALKFKAEVKEETKNKAVTGNKKNLN